MLKGWDDAVCGWTVVKGRRMAVYDADRAVVMLERQGMSHAHATSMVTLAMHVPGRRIWVRPASAADLRAAAEQQRHLRRMRKLRGDDKE